MNELINGLSKRLNEDVLASLKNLFVGKDEIIDLMGVALVAGENLFMLGPPGTAKSALVQEMGRLLEGETFDYLLTRFTEPNEIFGPFDIRKLREGELLTNTEGMLPEASLVFLDELLNANSAILNSLLNVLNERVFRRGKETRKLPLLMTIGASNNLPEDESLRALFDRFLLRVHCDNVSEDQLLQVLEAGRNLEKRALTEVPQMTVDEVRKLNRHINQVNLNEMIQVFLGVIHKLRQAGIQVSDRRAVKLQKVVAASALLAGREEAVASDIWVLRYIWDTEEQQEVIASIVNGAIDEAEQTKREHPRARKPEAPNPEILNRDLEVINGKLLIAGISEAEKTILKDNLSEINSRISWVEGDEQRQFLTDRINEIWSNLK
jgi:MoxR-like ATPase